MAWIDVRRMYMLQMNRDNVVFENGVANIKGLPMRDDGVEPMKAGDYATFWFGGIKWDAYVPQIDHQFAPFQGLTTTLTFERGEGFALRTALGGGSASPWLIEQAGRPD